MSERSRRPADRADSPSAQRTAGWRAWLRRFVRDWAAVVLVAAVGLTGFAKVGEDVFAHESTRFDVCCTLAYVSWREGFIRGRAALGLATIVPLLVGFSRLYLNVPWATDVPGGWCAGLLIAVLSATLYNRYRRRRAADRWPTPAAPTPTIKSLQQ